MEFKKCVRCGCFFASANQVCCNCESKDKFEIARLNGIIEESEVFDSIEELSSISGVNLNNLNRYIESNKISGLDINSLSNNSADLL